MHANGSTLLMPGLELDTARYTASLDDRTESETGEYCPLCGERIRFGQHPEQGPNGWRLHARCYEIALHEATEAYKEGFIVDIHNPRGKWLSNAIFEALYAREEQYDTDKYPELWNPKNR